MRKYTLLLATVVAVVVTAFAGSALAVSNGGGNSANAPGQAKAAANCGGLSSGTIGKQVANGVQAGGGPKAAEAGPTNCDHYWQTSGAIGNTP